MTSRHGGAGASYRLVELLMALAASAGFSGLATAQGDWDHAAFAGNVVIPQARVLAANRAAAVEVTGVNVGVVIVEQVATTTMDVSLRNPTNTRTEAELLVPVPDGAVVRGFTFEGAAGEPQATLLRKYKARYAYEAIVARLRDPALLEFAGCNLIRSSVFPLAPGGTQKVRLTYEHVLTQEGARTDYILPRSESLDYRTPWDVSVRIKTREPIATVYSPTHALETVRGGPGVVSVRIAKDARTQPGPFRVSYLMQRDGLSASLLAYPEAGADGGYFLLLAGLPADAPDGATADALRREITLVLDRSGSMGGEKIAQAKSAALQVLAGLHEGETFNIIAYNDTLMPLAAQPLAKNAQTERDARAFIERLTASGGTSIYAALGEALCSAPAPGSLPIILFLTDGRPTVGQVSEIAIRNLVSQQNPHARRVFTFGVGLDVNTPLLERLATDTRAAATFVLPKEDVEVAVSRVFAGLSGPLLADPRLAVTMPDGEPVAGRVSDLLPAMLPDLFVGDQLVVLGRYHGSAPLHFQVSGNYLGRPRTFRFEFPLDNATVRNAFVPRLWASRRIGVLVDQIRQMGADLDARGLAAAARDPHLAELTQEVVRLGTEFGILTEYTAFLARTGTDLSRRDAVLSEAVGSFQRRGLATRSGMGAVNQSLNTQSQARQVQLNYDNAYFDENLNRVAIANVQQVSDRVFFQRADRWIDGRIVAHADLTPGRTVVFGTPEFYELAGRLAAEGRAGCLALGGEILLKVGEETVLVKGK